MTVCFGDINEDQITTSHTFVMFENAKTSMNRIKFFNYLTSILYLNLSFERVDCHLRKKTLTCFETIYT